MGVEDGGESAEGLVNQASFARLREIIRNWGEDPQAGRIARAIVAAREEAPITSTTRLAEVVAAAYPAKWRATARQHPATRTFQALRMVDEPEPCHYGGVVSAPAVKDITLRMLSYLGRMPDSVQATKTAPAAAAAGEPVAQACPVNHNDKAIMDIAQAPKGDAAPVPTEVHAVPNFSGMPLRRAVEILMRKGIVPRLEGQGLVVAKQSPAPGAPWPGEDKAEFVLWLTRPSG